MVWGGGGGEEHTSDTGITRRVALTADCATFEDMAKGVGCQLRVVERGCVKLTVVVVKVVRFPSWSQAFSGPDPKVWWQASDAYMLRIWITINLREKLLINWSIGL